MPAARLACAPSQPSSREASAGGIPEARTPVRSQSTAPGEHAAPYDLGRHRSRSAAGGHRRTRVRDRRHRHVLRARRQMTRISSKLPPQRHVPSLSGTTDWLYSPPLGRGRLAREGRPRRLLHLHMHQLAPHALVCSRVVPDVPSSWTHRNAASILPSSPSSTTLTMSAEPSIRWRSTGRSPSTTTTRSGTPSRTTIGRPVLHRRQRRYPVPA
jgi:hypothetical protein